ncbi:MAG: hypothetical protein ACHQ52_12620, partial [Candidatus Eisenbacteria bacterium]
PGPEGRTRVDDDTWPDLRANSGAVTNIALENIRESAGQLTFTARVRARGWQTPRGLPGVVGTASAQTGPGPRAAPVTDGSVVLVSSEASGGGRPEIRLRTEVKGGTWQPVEAVSHSGGSAVDPAVAAVPRGGLAVVWSDSRDGANQLWFRTKLNGVWSAETRLTSLPGSSRNPSIGVDGRGFVHIAWLYTEVGVPQVRYMRFWFLKPDGVPTAVTTASNRPDAPGMTVQADGTAFILWSERSVNPVKIWFCRASGDSGVGPPNRLTVNDFSVQQGLCAQVDAAGVLHTVWLVPNVSLNELHYQRREPWPGPPSIRDTVLDRRGEPMQNLSLAVDPNGGLHLAYEVANAGTPQVLYRHAPQGRGWDVLSTEVTLPGDGIAARPAVVALDPSIASVLYLSYPGGVSAWTERHRDAWLPAAPTAVTDAVTPARSWLGLMPDPARPGMAVRVVWAGPPLAEGTQVTVYDLAGRRIAQSRLAHVGGTWVTTLSPEVTRGWATGVYFARIDGQRGGARLVLLR